jgi:hypothetical protein
MTATVQQYRTGVIIDDLWYGAPHPTGIYGGPQPSGAACTVLARAFSSPDGPPRHRAATTVRRKRTA